MSYDADPEGLNDIYVPDSRRRRPCSTPGCEFDAGHLTPHGTPGGDQPWPPYPTWSEKWTRLDEAGNPYAEGPYEGPFVWTRCGECGGYGNRRYTVEGDSIGCSPCGGLGRVKIVSEVDSLAGADAVDRPASACSSGAGGSNT